MYENGWKKMIDILIHAEKILNNSKCPLKKIIFE